MIKCPQKDLKEWDIEITRTGESTDTQYNFIPEEKFPLTEDEIKEIDEFKGIRLYWINWQKS